MFPPVRRWVSLSAEPRTVTHSYFTILENGEICSVEGHTLRMIFVTARAIVALPAVGAVAILGSMTHLILASASPRRRTLIQLFDLPTTIRVADVDERQIDHPDPARNAIETAWLKAAAVAAQVQEAALVIGADTIVALDGEILGKPRDSAEAYRMLRRLRGRVHQVHTGIAVIDTTTGHCCLDVATVAVPMRAYSQAELAAYIATGDPFDKAGAYAIQHPEFQPVADLHGCYAGVVGLPLCHLGRALRQLGAPVSPMVAERCQAHHAYDCPVWREIWAAPPPSDDGSG